VASVAEFESHVREIIRAAEGGETRRDPDIVASWLRCLNDHRLDPEHKGEARILTADKLRLHQQEAEEFLRMARYGMEDLYRRVNSMGYVLLLTDAKGVTVDFIGDDKVDRELKRAGLYIGSEWSESGAGTCGVGACLASGEPIVVHQTDHFDIAHTPLSCTAAPIYDTRGQLLGVMDVSLLLSPSEKHSQALALEVVKSCVRRIELANLIANRRSDWIVRMSASPEFLDVDPHCAVSVAADGTISGMTHGAQRLMAEATSVDWRHPQALIGRHFEDIFDFDMDNLAALRNAHAPDEQAVETRKGGIVFASALAPTAAPGRRSASTGLPASLEGVHGGDPALQRLCEKAAKVLDKQISVILQGETGVGKEFIAKAMHAARKKKGPFVAINCAALPETLIESELFGYAPNAFTGAHARGKKGLIEQADGGTLFLDEIGDMPLALQARLLRVLAEREVMSVGSTRPVPVDIRVISASHRDLQDLVESGQFRRDLYYRLNGVVLEIPPVRERQDREWLIGQIAAATETAGRPLQFSSAALVALTRYDWPGNVREMMNVCELCAALFEDTVVEAEQLPDHIRRNPEPNATGREAECSDRDHAALLTVLAKNSWNISAAARDLGVDRTTLHRRMKRLGVVTPNNA